MARTRIASLLGASAAALVSLAALAADNIARFDGGIGSQPLRAGVPGGVAAQVNDAFGIPPGGRPWVIADLKATVKADGSISVDGKGLLLGGGNGIGTTGGQSVRARLVCPNAAVNPPQFLDSATVPLEPDGDFKIRGLLTPAVIPVDANGQLCSGAALLILNGTGAAWFAGGIPKL